MGDKEKRLLTASVRSLDRMGPAGISETFSKEHPLTRILNQFSFRGEESKIPSFTTYVGPEWSFLKRSLALSYFFEKFRLSEVQKRLRGKETAWSGLLGELGLRFGLNSKQKEALEKTSLTLDRMPFLGRMEFSKEHPLVFMINQTHKAEGFRPIEKLKIAGAVQWFELKDSLLNYSGKAAICKNG